MTEPYISANPGDLITSENWNQMQMDIREDVGEVRTEVEDARGEFETLSERFDNNPGPQGEDGAPGPPGEDGAPGPTGPAPEHEWDETRLRFQNPDRTWGPYTDLQGPAGGGGGAETLIHLLANSLENKVQVYVGLYRFYYAKDMSGIESFLLLAQEALDMLRPGTIHDVETFVEGAGNFVGWETALARGTIAALVEDGTIADRNLEAYTTAIEFFDEFLSGLRRPITDEQALRLARLMNSVSMHAAMLVPAPGSGPIPIRP